MKPAPFEYRDPRTVDEVIDVLAEHGEDSKILAGGQSLVPLLNFRLAQPAMLVDINRVEELSFLRCSAGVLTIGATCRQATLEQSIFAQARWPLLGEAVDLVAHSQIRNRGTVGGSAAHADPAAELPVALSCLDARFNIRSASGTRTVGADEFFSTHLTTVIEPDELLVSIEVDPPPAGAGYAFCEYSRRHGDFALGGAAVQLADGEVRIALLGASDTPLRATEAEQALAGQQIDAETAAEAGELAVREVEPTGDIHGSGEYRRRLTATMVKRALLLAADRDGREAA
ncbi:MAG TPA: xanthine dehydrogenase family protein subunit M [Conexibacter sp.]|jgi:carbon-monoxide dehydrogenase medium subunit/6-hydroxypseudooxynicotine dehydrogenase subunit alpha